MHLYPDKKLYNLKLEVDDKVLFVKYRQATAEETMDYFQVVQQGEEKIKSYRLNFIQKNIILTKYHKRNPIARIRILRKIESQLHTISKQLHETYHRIWKSVYTGLPKPKSKTVSLSLFDNSYTAITEATHIPSDRIYKRLTFEQIGRWIDKLTFDAYNSYDEGKAVNKMLSKETNKDKYKAIADMVEREFANMPKKK